MTSWKLQGKQIFLILSVVFLSIALIVKVIFEQTNIPASQLVKSIKLSKVFDVSEKSTVNISIKDDNLRFDFNIKENEALEVNNFSEKLGISNSWMNGFEVGLDKASIEKIRKILPVSLNLEFEEEKVIFNSDQVFALSVPAKFQETEISTLSSKLNTKYSNERDFEVSIEDPEIFLTESIKSGRFRVSSKIFPLFPIISKISKIDLKVQGKSIEGKIELK